MAYAGYDAGYQAYTPAPAARSGGEGGGGSLPYIGAKISLVSNSKIRYHGTLYSINEEKSTIGLTMVRSYGSEDRLPRHVPAIPARPETYSYIIFHGKDIAELTVLDDPSGVQSDPAILDAEIASTEVASGNPPGLGSADKSRGQQLPYGARPTANARNMPAAAHGSYSDAPRGGGKAGGILSHPQPLAKGSSFDGGKGKGKGKGGNDVYFGKGGGMAKGGQEKGKAKGKGYDSYGKAGGQMYMGKGGYDNYGKGKGGDFSKGKGKSDGNSWYYNRNPNQNRANRPVAGVNMPNAKKDDEYVKDLEFEKLEELKFTEEEQAKLDAETKTVNYDAKKSFFDNFTVAEEKTRVTVDEPSS